MQGDWIKHRRFRWIDKRERWGLTLWGWAAALLGLSAIVLILVPGINDFLAIDCPVRGEILVLEGWIPDYAIGEAVAEFGRGGYKRMIAVSGPIEKGSYLSEFKSYARLTQATLSAQGFDEGLIGIVEIGSVKKDRTYSSAKAVRQWAESQGMHVHALDVYTLGVHARRSRLLFQEAFGDGVAVGVIAAEDRRYDAKSWWKSSEGVRDVMSELIAYVYALLFFHPSEEAK